MRTVCLLVVMFWLPPAVLGKINIKAFGAVGDGVCIDSPAINAALETASKNGGDTVVVPEGIYLCYSIHLQSNITLRLEAGAVLKAAPVTDREGYDEAEPNDSHYQDFGHSHWHNSLLWGENLHHLTIEGEGLIDGTDVLYRDEPKRGYTGMPQANKALALRDCHHVAIRDVSFLKCGHFAMLLTGVDDLLIENVKADTNRDGFDIDCCERVTVRGCHVNTMNDDAIVLKCSYALGRPKPTQQVLIDDCHVSGYDVGSFLDGTCTTNSQKAPDGDGPTGRIKLGTESNGGFQDITIRNCTFTHCRGLALETVDGAPMENIHVSNIKMTDICNSPIYIRLGDRMRAPKGFHPSTVKDISIRNVYVTNADSRYACLIASVKNHPVRDVLIDSLYVQFRGGLTLEDVKLQRGCNPFFFQEKRLASEIGESNYPEPSAHGIQPAWGFSIIHAEDIELRRIHLETINKDERPWLYKKDAKCINIRNPIVGNGMFEMSSKTQEKPARSLNYYPDGRDIVCVNGQNRYTRALYGGHTLFRLETSDRPLFATYNNEKSKNIRFYLTYRGQTLRLDSTDYCEARYQGGWRGYKVRDKRWGSAELQVNSLARLDNEGAVWQFYANGFEGDVKLSVKMCQTAVLKMNRAGDLGLVPRSNFDPSPDEKGLKTLEWDATGETYLVFSDNEMLEHPTTEKGREIYTLTDEGRKAIVGQVEFTTPDPYINTLGANICAAADGTWDGQTWLHGAIGWRVPLAGWRGGYSGDALGWPKRQKSHFDAYTKSIVTDVPQIYPLPSQDPKNLLARAEKKWGTGMYSNGYLCRLPGRNDVMNHYDMNLNFFDELFWHFRYDADTTYLRKMWPYIKLHLEWEKRNWDADGDHLYDAYCCIWASDALYYNGGNVTHSSAYNYKGNRFAARIAELLGEDPTPWQQEADAILKAMNERLWLKDEGHWAEFEDLMGEKRLHKSAAVWSIYTPIDCDACSPEQAWQATEYVDMEIPHIPIRIKDSNLDGKYQTISTTNWLPYDWSTNNVAHEEVMNTALAYFQAGRSEQGFNLLKADVLDGMFLGQSPGNFGQISYYDKARSEAYRDFADNVGISSRTLVNGLFGILPDALFGKCYIKPAFPEAWDSCNVRTPFLSYKFHRTATQDIYEIEQHFAQPLQMIVKTSIGGGIFVETVGNSHQRQTIVVDRTSLPKARMNQMANPSKAPAHSPQNLSQMGLDEPTPAAKYKAIDISQYFNANVDDIFKNDYLSPRPPYTTLEMPLHGIGQWCHPERMVPIEDDGFRAKIEKGLFDTGLGFSFLSPKTGPNIVYTSLWDNYPDAIAIPVEGKAHAAWLLLAGSTNEMQSRIDNAIIVATYQDGTSDTLRLENPTNWCPIEQDYYLDGLAFTAATKRPYRVHLGSGTVSRHLAPVVGICDWDGKTRQDLNSAEPQIIPNGAAQMLKMPLNPNKALRELQLRTLSNDVITGLMGMTLEQ